ncbi:TerB family tellurite resistance protein [Pontivivens nitratireducens]|uniref:tellurite resistance TerB family protein n=1 Tax=Pontivivens nitratireducens TaxID=2758038 RepID=UPI001639EC12|nr:TerB family tellurite resistance protein [Pontibrevibacter nitratireducens]
MFADLLRKLTGTPEDTTLDASDARLAMAALLVRVARADDLYHPAEVARIDAVLRHRYGLIEADAVSLRTEAEALEAQASDTVRFTRLIKDAVPYEERDAVIEAMWYVALSDDDRSEDENALLRMVANLIGVTDRDSALARQRAANRL